MDDATPKDMVGRIVITSQAQFKELFNELTDRLDSTINSISELIQELKDSKK